MGAVISLSVQNRIAAMLQVAGQIETPRPPDPILRRPRADREEKRVTHGNGLRREEQLDSNNPNQRGHLDRETRPEPFLVHAALGPYEWFGGFVVAVDELLDMGLEVSHVLERSPVQRLAGEDGEP